MPYSPLISKIRVHNPNKKGSAVANRNYAHYIATRAGVSLEEVDNINDALNNEKILEMNLNENIIHQEASDEDYVRYMARRPRSHGLFGNINTDDLDKVVQEVGKVSSQGRIIYRGIISLGEKDGAELGFRNVNAWNNYLKRVMPDIAQKLGVSPTDHTWIAAFHAEESHPHVHYELWDNKDKVRSPYIHTSVQKDIRNMLSQEMFDDAYERSVRQVFQEQLSELKENRNRERSEILDQAKKLINEVGYVPGVAYERLPDKIQPEELKKITQETSRLIDMLPKSGRLTYKFLPPEAKEQLTKLSDLIINRIDMQREISAYLNTIKEMHGYYGETKTEIKNAQLQGKADIEKRIKNALLREIVNSIQITTEKEPNLEFKENSNVDIELHVDDIIPIINQDYYIEWNDSYKNAMNNLYGENPDLEKGFDILEQEAIKRNAIAIEKIGTLIEKQIGNNIDVQEADEFFVEARKAYQDVYDQTDNDYIKTYAAYRMGKMTLDGIGTTKSVEKAIDWLKQAADLGNENAQYSLAKIYLEEKDFEKVNSAIKMLEKLDEKNNMMAEYTLGSIYADRESRYYNLEKAIGYLERSAEQDNQFAEYKLGVIYADPEGQNYNLEKAIGYLERSAEQDNQFAEYKLGVIYADPKGQNYDLEKAIRYFGQSAIQDNQSARYALGVIYADPEGQNYNLDVAITYFKKAAEQGNEYAQYKLGSIYTNPENKQYDIKKGISYLEQAANKGNAYAQCKLGMIYYYGKGVDQNKEIGRKWLEKAAEQNNQMAKQVLDDTTLDMGMGISYALVKAALSSMESMNQQGQYQSRMAAQSVTKHRSKTKKQVKAMDFMPERI